MLPGKSRQNVTWISTLGDRDEFGVYAINLPAREVGGDFYDFLMVDEPHLAVVIGDVRVRV